MYSTMKTGTLSFPILIWANWKDADPFASPAKSLLPWGSLYSWHANCWWPAKRKSPISSRGTFYAGLANSSKTCGPSPSLYLLITFKSQLSMAAWRRCSMSVSTSSELNSGFSRRFLSDPRLLRQWENAYRHTLSKCAPFQWWHLQHLCPVQAKVRPAQIETSNIVHDIVPYIVYDISYHIVYDVDIRYFIPITMEDYVLVLCYVYIVPLIYLNSLLKGYPRWNRSLQKNGKALRSQLEVFLIDVNPIWKITQELMNWSRISSRELSGRNILVHEITMIIKRSKSISLLSIDGGRGTLAPALGLKVIYRIRYRSRYRVRYWERSKKTLFGHSILIRPDIAPISCRTSKFLPLISLYPDIAIRNGTRYWIKYRTNIECPKEG